MRKKIAGNCYQFFCKIFCIKHFLQKNVVKNTCEFHNFVGNNYSPRITCQLKFLEKIAGKSLFLQFSLTNLQENSHVIFEFLVVSVMRTMFY